MPSVKPYTALIPMAKPPIVAVNMWEARRRWLGVASSERQITSFGLGAGLISTPQAVVLSCLLPMALGTVNSAGGKAPLTTA